MDKAVLVKKLAKQPAFDANKYSMVLEILYQIGMAGRDKNGNTICVDISPTAIEELKEHRRLELDDGSEWDRKFEEFIEIVEEDLNDVSSDSPTDSITYLLY